MLIRLSLWPVLAVLFVTLGHVAKYSCAGWNRNLRAQKFTWRAHGSPDFGIPVSTGVPLPRPAETPPTRP